MGIQQWKHEIHRHRFVEITLKQLNFRLNDDDDDDDNNNNNNNNKEETERKMVTAQDQAFGKNSFKNKILKEETDSKFRLCKEHKETTDHLTSGCHF